MFYTVRGNLTDEQMMGSVEALAALGFPANLQFEHDPDMEPDTFRLFDPILGEWLEGVGRYE